MKDLAGLLNQLSLNTLIFQVIDHYQEVFFIDLPVESKIPRKGLINIKNYDKNVFYGAMLDILIL